MVVSLGWTWGDDERPEAGQWCDAPEPVGGSGGEARGPGGCLPPGPVHRVGPETADQERQGATPVPVWYVCHLLERDEGQQWEGQISIQVQAHGEWCSLVAVTPLYWKQVPVIQSLNIKVVWDTSM